MSVALAAMNGQSSWARQVLRTTNDEIDWNHKVATSAHVVIEDIDIVPEYNESSRFPEPVLYMSGKVQSMTGNFGYGVDRVVFDDGMLGGEPPLARFRWSLTPRESAQLYLLGLATKDFAIPDYLLNLAYDLPVDVSVDTVVPTSNGVDVPIMVVNMMGDGAIAMDSQKSGYADFIAHYFKPSPTMKEHADELSEFNRTFSADAPYVGMRVLEDASRDAEYATLFDDVHSVDDIIDRMSGVEAVAEATDNEKLAADIVAEIDESNTFDSLFGFDDVDEINEIEEAVEEVETSQDESTDDALVDMLFGDSIAENEFDDETDEEEKTAETNRRYARNRVAAEVAAEEFGIEEKQIIAPEVDDNEDNDDWELSL